MSRVNHFRSTTVVGELRNAKVADLPDPKAFFEGPVTVADSSAPGNGGPQVIIDPSGTVAWMAGTTATTIQQNGSTNTLDIRNATATGKVTVSVGSAATPVLTASGSEISISSNLVAAKDTSLKTLAVAGETTCSGQVKMKNDGNTPQLSLTCGLGSTPTGVTTITQTGALLEIKNAATTDAALNLKLGLGASTPAVSVSATTTTINTDLSCVGSSTTVKSLAVLTGGATCSGDVKLQSAGDRKLELAYSKLGVTGTGSTTFAQTSASSLEVRNAATGAKVDVYLGASTTTPVVSLSDSETVFSSAKVTMKNEVALSGVLSTVKTLAVTDGATFDSDVTLNAGAGTKKLTLAYRSVDQNNVATTGSTTFTQKTANVLEVRNDADARVDVTLGGKTTLSVAATNVTCGNTLNMNNDARFMNVDVSGSKSKFTQAYQSGDMLAFVNQSPAGAGAFSYWYRTTADGVTPSVTKCILQMNGSAVTAKNVPLVTRWEDVSSSATSATSFTQTDSKTLEIRTSDDNGKVSVLLGTGSSVTPAVSIDSTGTRVNGAFSCYGATTVNNALTVSDTTTCNGDVILAKSLYCGTGSTTLKTLTCNGDITLNGGAGTNKLSIGYSNATSGLAGNTTLTQTTDKIFDVKTNSVDGKVSVTLGSSGGGSSLVVDKQGATITNTVAGNTGQTALCLQATGSTKSVLMIPNAGDGTLNPLTKNGDSMIAFSKGSSDLGTVGVAGAALTIAPWSDANAGLRLTRTTAEIGKDATLSTAKLSVFSKSGLNGSTTLSMSESTGSSTLELTNRNTGAQINFVLGASGNTALTVADGDLKCYKPMRVFENVAFSNNNTQMYQSGGTMSFANQVRDGKIVMAVRDNDDTAVPPPVYFSVGSVGNGGVNVTTVPLNVDSSLSVRDATNTSKATTFKQNDAQLSVINASNVNVLSIHDGGVTYNKPTSFANNGYFTQAYQNNNTLAFVNQTLNNTGKFGFWLKDGDQNSTSTVQCLSIASAVNGGVNVMNVPLNVDSSLSVRSSSYSTTFTQTGSTLEIKDSDGTAKVNVLLGSDTVPTLSLGALSATVNGAFSCTGDMTLAKDLYCSTGTSNLKTLNVSGATTCNGDITLNGGAGAKKLTIGYSNGSTVTGTTTFTQKTEKIMEVSNTATGASVDVVLDNNGTKAVSMSKAETRVGSDTLSVTNALNVSGNSTLSTLTTTGNVYVSGNLSVGGAITQPNAIKAYGRSNDMNGSFNVASVSVGADNIYTVRFVNTTGIVGIALATITRVYTGGKWRNLNWFIQGEIGYDNGVPVAYFNVYNIDGILVQVPFSFIVF